MEKNFSMKKISACILKNIKLILIQKDRFNFVFRDFENLARQHLVNRSCFFQKKIPIFNP